MAEKLIVENRRARHDYQLLERFEAGIVLQGTEVKSLRAGRATLGQAYADVRDGEAWLHGADGFALVIGDTLTHLYVRPDAIGKGIGHALFEHVTERRPDGFDFWVFQQNERARRFYERHGAEPVEFGDGSGNEEGAPDVRYEWRPQPARGSSVR